MAREPLSPSAAVYPDGFPLSVRAVVQLLTGHPAGMEEEITELLEYLFIGYTITDYRTIMPVVIPHVLYHVNPGPEVVSLLYSLRTASEHNSALRDEVMATVGAHQEYFHIPQFSEESRLPSAHIYNCCRDSQILLAIDRYWRFTPHARGMVTVMTNSDGEEYHDPTPNNRWYAHYEQQELLRQNLVMPVPELRSGPDFAEFAEYEYEQLMDTIRVQNQANPEHPVPETNTVEPTLTPQQSVSAILGDLIQPENIDET